ncbi:hypothetical protein BD413DRAFT_480284, partial [Trametes elegans]
APPPFDKQTTDLILQTSNNVAFHVWMPILAEASPVFADMFALADRRGSLRPSESDPADSPAHEGVRTSVISLPESSSTLADLLRMCYPPPHAKFASLEKLQPVIAAAHKYQMEGVMALLAVRLVELAADVPLRAYAIATRYDMRDVMVAAARRLLTRDRTAAEDYVLELDDISASAYQRLLAYRRECSSVAANVCTNVEWLTDAGWTFMQCTGCPRDPKVPSCKLRDSDTSRQPTAWFWQHYKRMEDLLRERPSGETLSDPLLISPALKIAVRCTTCREPAYEQMLRFTHKLKKEVTERIAQVR